MSKLKKKLRVILKVILYICLSLLIAVFMRLFLCDFYRVPSSSMSPTILGGDFILTDKWTYGARIFTNMNFEKNNKPSFIRIPGFKRIKRNDIVVFNFPFREYHVAWDTIGINYNSFFVKRCIGIPGDSLSSINGFYHIAGSLDTLGYIPALKRQLRNCSIFDSQAIKNHGFDSSLNWDRINFGPYYIPSAGKTIELTPLNIILYHKQIVYETDAVVNIEDSLVYINDTLRCNYTFSSNWYFMAGDNAIMSEDSRYFGLVPEAHIVGRALIVLSSNERSTGKRRLNRMFKRIK